MRMNYDVVAMNDTNTTTKPAGGTRPASSYISRLSTISDCRAMLAALRAEPSFVITETEETITVLHPRSGKTVFSALSKGTGQPWIVRYHRNLFV